MKLGSNSVWNPSKEGSLLKLWLAHNTGYTDNSGLEHWTANIAGSTARWSQTTADNRPAITSDFGIDFDGSTDYISGTQFTLPELFTIGMHISEYSHAGYSSHDPTRIRKLLLHKKELNKISRSINEKGMTLIPLKLYFKGGRVKLEFATAKGKRLWDKRQDIMKKDMLRQADRTFKNKKMKL